MRATTIALLTSCLTVLSACASIVQGSSQRFTVIQPAQPTSCSITNGRGTVQAVTPNTVFVKKSKTDIKVTCVDQARGLQGEQKVESHLENWTAGNILIGGLIGLGIDAGTGAMWEYPKEVSVPMTQAYGYGAQSMPQVMPQQSMPPAAAPTTYYAPAPAAAASAVAAPAAPTAAANGPVVAAPAYQFVPVQPAYAPAPAATGYAPAYPAATPGYAPAAPAYRPAYTTPSPFGGPTPAGGAQYYAPAANRGY